MCMEGRQQDLIRCGPKAVLSNRTTSSDVREEGRRPAALAEAGSSGQIFDPDPTFSDCHVQEYELEVSMMTSVQVCG